MRRFARFAPVALSFLALVGCNADTSESTGLEEGEFSSNQATLLEFDFDAELTTDRSWDDKQTIQDQLLYTIGHLNTDKSVGRLDKLALSNIQRTDLGGGKIKLAYHAKLPVAWGSKTNLPTTYELVLPMDVSTAGISAFTEKHKRTCVDFGAHDVDAGSMWYYYRPRQRGCAITAEEVVTVEATAKPSTENTTGKYPEYHRIWEDNRLEVIAIFGKYESKATSGDAGISAYNAYVAKMKRELRLVSSTVTTLPENVSDAPGPQTIDVSFEATLADGKVVKITALLVDAITEVPPGFDARYEGLTPTADVIMYNGHAGLGQNVRALAAKGEWVAGKYQMIFMNGCDTYAYVDGALAETRAKLNPDDPTGSKYMDIVTNAMPSFFHSMPAASTAIIKGLLAYEQPKTYDQIFEDIDRAEIVLVTGEEDNSFEPGMPIGGGGGGGGGGDFKPFEESGTVARGAESTYAYDVPAGTYVVELSGDGDGDLYVKKDAAATARSYDCRPYKSGSSEKCVVTFDEAGKLNVMVRGYAPTTTYKVAGSKQ